MADRKSFVSILRAVAVAVTVVVAGSAPATLAQEARPAEVSTRLPPDVVTEHVLELPDRTLRFKATAGSIPITNSKGKVLAEMGYISYTLDGMRAGQRPVTFVLNGGPGASSAWLHIGSLGPWRIDMEKAAASPSAPVPLLPNAETWLDFTDLVFIDPVGTGFSQMVPKDLTPAKRIEIAGGQVAQVAARTAARPTSGRSGDIRSISEFIRSGSYKNDRLASPKLFVGESYGGFRGENRSQSQTERGITLMR